jgi:hypothetical protein
VLYRWQTQVDATDGEQWIVVTIAARGSAGRDA